MPVDVVDFFVIGGLDDIEHVLGGVRIHRTWGSTVAFEVLEESLRLLAKV